MKFSVNRNSLFYLKIQNHINWFAFFVAFPVVILFGINFSFLYFILIFFLLVGKYPILKIKDNVLILPLLFAIGAVISVIDLNSKNPNALDRSLQVLPNYIYWTLLVIILVNLRQMLNIVIFSKYITLGIVLTFIFYIIQDNFSAFKFILNPLSPNSLSFIIICFAAPCFVYLNTVKKNKIFSYGFLILSVFFLILEGRRAGTVLVFFPCLLSLLFSKIKIQNLILGFIVFILGFALLQQESVKNTMEQLNPRIYELVYESENITTGDQSYLVRRLQVEKAIIIFLDNPITGIGLNNFGNYSVEFQGNFEGSELVIRKEKTNETSAHNSYIMLLAEGGLLLLIPFILLLIYNIIKFINFYNYRSKLENAFYWSYLAMNIHFYFIAEIVNVHAWFTISITTLLSVKYSKIKNIG